MPVKKNLYAVLFVISPELRGGKKQSASGRANPLFSIGE
jgi:hypothetical protein